MRAGICPLDPVYPVETLPPAAVHRGNGRCCRCRWCGAKNEFFIGDSVMEEGLPQKEKSNLSDRAIRCQSATATATGNYIANMQTEKDCCRKGRSDS